jgi:hypothetical protein
LLFNDCHKYCVDFDLQAAHTKEQETCINNCQEKTYKAFDMYLTTAHAFALRRDYRHYVDISKYTGMEAEHKHDTVGKYAHLQSPHVNTKEVEDFQ